MRVTVVHALPRSAVERSVELPAGATVADALRASGLLAAVGPLDGLDVGVFGRPCALAQALHDGDRVEIYRPLAVDPMQARRIRAELRRRRGKTPASG